MSAATSDRLTLEDATPSQKRQALRALRDAVDNIESLRGAAVLRNLADQADAMAELVAAAKAHSWVMADLLAFPDALEDLSWQSATIARVAKAYWLAEDLGNLAVVVRRLRRYQCELDEALWQLDEVPLGEP